MDLLEFLPKFKFCHNWYHPETRAMVDATHNQLIIQEVEDHRVKCRHAISDGSTHHVSYRAANYTQQSIKPCSSGHAIKNCFLIYMLLPLKIVSLYPNACKNVKPHFYGTCY